MKKIVICGSMSLVDKLKSAAAQLNEMGYIAILPEEDVWDSIPKDKVNEYKKEVSMRHFTEVAKEDTHAILVVNEPKKGIGNYIGANTFAEIAIAFYFSKMVFLLNDIYDPLSDELSGWGAVPLYGNIRAINDFSRGTR